MIVAQMSLLDAALTYASWGWPVLPLVPGGKVPATAHGVHDATTDPGTIRQWWAQQPTANVGIAAGRASGLVVADIDPRNGGDTSWARWLSEHGAGPDGPIALTAGGGEHHLYLYTPELRSCKLADGVDLLSDGRYFVASPSIVGGREYVWEASSDPLEGVAPPPVPSAWLAAYLARERRSPTTTGELIRGNRNAGLTALAGAMRRHGMGESEILAALRVANETRCDIPLPSSEVARIAASVARYEPASDLAASAALGDEAAETLLAPDPDWLIPADAFSAAPAPISWLIKGWLQDSALMMVHGPSGGGKTFVVLDMCLRLASGMAEWMGRKVRPADVVYLAGEGHHGLRGRIAGWKFYHGCKVLSMWLSRAGVDLNTPEGYAKALQQIRKLPRKPRLIIVDTLHRFLLGDENSAQDAKTMLDACAGLMREFECSVLLVHHTGVSEEAQHRARGSSAWRGALDIEISVVPAKDDQPIQIVQRKSKDAELAQPLYASLQQVTIPGWVDEDGEPVTSAVITAVTAPVTAPSKAGNKIDQHRRMFERAWWDSGAELRDGAPYVSRSAMLDYLTTKAGLGESSAKLYVKPAATGKLISSLLDARTIEATEHGWRVIDPTHAASMVLQKASGGVG
jgi:hypothetical protein